MEARVAHISSLARAVLGRGTVDAKRFVHPYFVVNMVFAISFMLLRLVRPFCSMLFKNTAEGGQCELDLREHEVLIFVGCITVIKNRGAPTWQHYLKKFGTYAKVANVFLFYRQSPAYMIVYVVLCALQMVFLPEPIYSGPSKIEYFSGLDNMEKTISEDKRNVWIVCFFTTWSMKCIDMAPIFAELSAQYWLPNLRFGKVDIGRFSNVGEKYEIATGAWTRQLPTIICFKDGKEVLRRPFIDSKKRIEKYEYSMPTLVQDFDLNNEYEACKSKLGKKVLENLSNGQEKPAGSKKKD